MEDSSTVSRYIESSARFRMWFLYRPYNRIVISVAIAQVKQAKAAVH
jgi:hypothetical protein